MTNEVWRTSIAELLTTFREALEQLLPFLKKVRIPIGIHPGTDGWDEITETLFEQMVSVAIRWSLPQDQVAEFEFPVYEMSYETYAQFDFVLEVLADQIALKPPAARWIFQAFSVGSESSTLNTLLAIPVAEDWTVVGEPTPLPFDACAFRLSRVAGKSVERRVDSLEVRL